MKSATTLTVLVVFSLNLVAQSLPSAAKARNAESAKRLWEEVITAKGGRDRLQSVTSLGIRSRGPHSTYGRTAIQFPNREWQRSQAEDPIGLSISVVDGHKGWFEFIPGSGVKTFSVEEANKRLAADICQITSLYLLESKWYRPTIVAEDEGFWQDQQVRIIYINGCDGPSAYAIDPKSKLPLAFVLFGTDGFKEGLPPLPKQLGFGRYLLDDYQRVGELQMPMKRGASEFTYEVNRQYPGSLFTTPPALNDWGPWPEEQK